MTPTMTVEQLLADNPTIASLPDLYLRLTDAIGDPSASFDRIGRILREDIGFTARLLRIANSALYSFPAPVETVESAMSVIGTRQVQELALATTVLKMFDGVEHDLVSMESFWRHSLCCGAVARVIAILRRENNFERYFTLGMLHDVGRLILYQSLGEASGAAIAIARGERRLLMEVERERLGLDHAQVGECLLRQWNLPPAQWEPVGCHHRPDGARQYPLEAAILHVSDWIAHALQAGNSGEDLVPPLDAAAWQRLELAESLLTNIVDRAHEQYETAVRLFLNGH